ncbi:MAG: hypothetical protein JJT82_08495 [Legionellaceae bacterium]|nr:hypothetical protein [Legionellaceae bacterium]
MLINCRHNELQALRVTGRVFLLFLIYTLSLGVIEHYYFELFHPNTATMMVFGSGVGIFLAFRINCGYNRWWEARIIWGNLINEARNFGCQVSAALTNHPFTQMSAEEKQFQKEIIYNFIGYVNALRLHLRRQSPLDWDHELWTRTINGMTFFSEEECQRMQQKTNKPLHILSLINHKVSAFFTKEPDRELRYLHFMQLLSTFHTIQGMSERIKNTVFPWGYAYYTYRLVWLFAFLLPLGLVRGLEWANIMICAIISTVFVTIEQVGRNLDNPFEHSFNDTPISALCRTIEIDLLQQLNEPNVPEPLQPQKGILF